MSSTPPLPDEAATPSEKAPKLPDVALSTQDLEALEDAVRALEGPSFAARLSALAGKPLSLLGQALPQPLSAAISKSTEAALARALRFALSSIPAARGDPETRVHKILAAVSGALGGAMGLSAVVLELPVSTTIMLRSIARIAQSE